MKAIPSLLCVGAVYSVVLHLPGPVQVKLEEHISLNSSYIKRISKKKLEETLLRRLAEVFFLFEAFQAPIGSQLRPYISPDLFRPPDALFTAASH